MTRPRRCAAGREGARQMAPAASGVSSAPNTPWRDAPGDHHLDAWRVRTPIDVTPRDRGRGRSQNTRRSPKTSPSEPPTRISRRERQQVAVGDPCLAGQPAAEVLLDRGAARRCARSSRARPRTSPVRGEQAEALGAVHSDLEPLVLEVELALERVQDLVGDRAVVAQLDELAALRVEHLAHDALVGERPLVEVLVLVVEPRPRAGPAAGGGTRRAASMRSTVSSRVQSSSPSASSRASAARVAARRARSSSRSPLPSSSDAERGG